MRAVPRPDRRAADAGTIVLGADQQEIWQVAGAAAPGSYGPPNASEAMDVDIEINYLQNNQQNNHVQINLQEFIDMHQTEVNATANIQQVAVVGVDPQVAL